ncbi:adenylate/guanylate cyclase domain-containing protein [Aquipuribacter nitratireducens]|uniref:Adenylate/guanylate cyclase domain-containing protein n=1 Tax=Aquipuribacter nitratireducens TaxID=650104 RepID=A0ABW0GM68_9MICO
MTEQRSTSTGTQRTYTLREAARAVGVSQLSARKLFRALGYAEVADQPALGDTELSALELAAGMVRDGTLDEQTVLNLSRAVGRSLDRLATWQVESVAERVDGDPTATVALLEQLGPRLEALLAIVWRRLIDDAVDRVVVPAGEAFERAVGFADVVGWTQVVQSLDEPELADLVRRFGDVAGDVIADGGGRVIKTVGDEVMFSARGPEDAARTALELADAFHDEPLVPGVRVGFAHGPVVARLGDLFGSTVNLASRVCRLAGGGEVLTDARTATLLTGTPGLRLRPLGERQVRGVGRVPLVTVEPVGRREQRGGYAPGEHG